MENRRVEKSNGQFRSSYDGTLWRNEKYDVKPRKMNYVNVFLRKRYIYLRSVLKVGKAGKRIRIILLFLLSSNSVRHVSYRSVLFP